VLFAHFKIGFKEETLGKLNKHTGKAKRKCRFAYYKNLDKSTEFIRRIKHHKIAKGDGFER